MIKKDEETPASPTVRLTVWLLIVLFVTIILGSYLGKTEIVARGQGRVIPTSRVQVVQPQVNGKIIKIFVTEGQAVNAGDLLVTMDTTAVESEIKRIETDIAQKQQELSVARAILAPLTAIDPTKAGFVEAGKTVVRRENADRDIQGEEELVVATLSALKDQVAQVDAEQERVSRTYDAQQTRLKKARAEEDILSRRFTSAETLRKQGTISEFTYLDRLREQKARESDVLIAKQDLDGLDAEIKVLRRKRASMISSALSTYRKQSNEAEIALEGLRSSLNAARVQLSNLTLKAPVSGRIEKLSVFTLGGFVQAGASLMLIVPSDKDIEIEAFFDNRDFGFLQKGQKAFVKFDAFPAERFGIVRGVVTGVGADARGDVEAGKWVYAARLKLDQNTISLPEREIGFAPGMTATVDVITGERRLISYFFEPILKAFQDGLGER